MPGEPFSVANDPRLRLVFPFTTTMGCIRDPRALTQARTEILSPEFEIRPGSERDPFLAQTDTGECSN